LVNVNSTLGRGTVGTDLNAIPVAQIERIEILRDGASAQYGSDAIAGVINIVLKKTTHTSQINSQFGQTTQNDGQVAQLSLNKGLGISKKGGFLNLSIEGRFRSPTNRSGQYTGLVYLPSLAAGASTEAILANQQADQQLIKQNNFDLRPMVVGNAQSSNITGFYNLGLPLKHQWEFYSFGGINQRNGKSSGFYRFPNNLRTNNLRLYPNGYLPQILTDITDESLAIGFRKITKKDWNFDLSTNYGANKIQFNVENSLNASMRDASPSAFDVGQLQFRQSTTDLNVSRIIRPTNSKTYVSVALGLALRHDNYRILEGEPASYLDANAVGTPLNQIKAAGSQVFNGFRPRNVVNKSRSNLGIYADIESEIDERLLVNGAIRIENYSDFGGNVEI
jgi:iron complex outermembrane receptor protein